MTLRWVICGAGRGVGKTHLAQALCQILPQAVYAKHGCGTPRPDKPPHFFRTVEQLDAFVRSCEQSHQHLVIESNDWARQGRGDVIIFIEAAAGQTECRPDADLLRRRAHVHTGPETGPEDWQRVLRAKHLSPELCEAVCRLLSEQQRFGLRACEAVLPVTPLRISTDGGGAVADPGEVPIEEPLTIMVEGVGSFTLLCSPCDVQALVLGFLLSEGLIASAHDCLAFSHRPDQRVAAVRLESVPPRPARNLIVTSSCGLCGSRNLEQLMSGQSTVPDVLRVRPFTLRQSVEAMHRRQTIFARTGGTHAAAVFDADGQIISFGEDIGRHNAVDKAIGRCLLDERPLRSCGLALSGRVSLELVGKAVRAGIELIVAVSVPSSLAVQAAQRCGITLCGFVREQRATVYTHPHRIADVRQEEQGGSGGPGLR